MISEEIYRFVWWPKNVRPTNAEDDYWDSMIHPDDLLFIENGVFHGNIFKLIGTDTNYLKVTDGKNVLRIDQLKKDYCLQLIEYEGLFYNDSVTVLSNDGKNTVREGKISNLFYHSKDKCIIYHIESRDGKEIKKKYKSIDLQLKQHP